MGPPLRKSMRTTKPCSAGGKPPVGRQPIYLRDTPSKDGKERKEEPIRPMDNGEGSSDPQRMDIEEYQLRTASEGGSGPSTRRAMFRATLDPMEERERRGSKVVVGALQESAGSQWATRRRCRGNRGEASKDTVKDGRRLGKGPDTEGMGASHTPSQKVSLIWLRRKKCADLKCPSRTGRR